jgi:hypothetical protein
MFSSSIDSLQPRWASPQQGIKLFINTPLCSNYMLLHFSARLNTCTRSTVDASSPGGSSALLTCYSLTSLQVETGAVAALTQLTSLQLCVPHGTEPDQLSSLSSLWNLQLFALEGGPLHFCLHTCLPAWQQKLQVLNLSTKSLYLQWEDLQLLASLPHLHSLTCYGIQLRCSEGQVCLPALRTLSFSMGDDIWTVAPSQVAALLVPVLESVRGKLCIQLLCDHRQDQEQMLADLQKAATGILQAASDVRVFYEGDHDGTPDDLLNIFQALTPWRPLQHGRECKLSLYWSALDSSTASVAALSHVPPAVQHLW